MNSNQSRKRKKKYFNHGGKKAKRWGILDAGMSGFLVTCNKREKEAVKEAYNLLDTYSDKLYESTSQDTNDGSSDHCDSDEDITAALEREAAKLAEKSNNATFKQVDSGANNCLFIKTTLSKPNEIADAIMSDVYDTGKAQSRHIMRFIPVLGTCRAVIDNIKQLAQTHLLPYFGEDDCDGHSYVVSFKARNHNTLSTKAVQEQIWRVIIGMSIKNRVDLQNPEYMVNINVIRSVCCMSVLRNYSKYRKYNLQELAMVKAVEENAKDPVNSKTELNKNGSSASEHEEQAAGSTLPSNVDCSVDSGDERDSHQNVASSTPTTAESTLESNTVTDNDKTNSAKAEELRDALPTSNSSSCNDEPVELESVPVLSIAAEEASSSSNGCNNDTSNVGEKNEGSAASGCQVADGDVSAATESDVAGAESTVQEEAVAD